MAGKKKDIQIETPIHNETEWDEMFEEKGVSVVDVHQGWCGPCKAILSMFRKLKMEFGNELLHFRTVQASLIPLLKGFEGKCEPAFLFIVAGKIVDYVKGVNAPVINQKIVAFLEEEVEFYEKGVQRQQVKTIQLYDVEDDIEEFMQGATTKQFDKLFTLVVIKPSAVTSGNDNIIKDKIRDAGFQIKAEEMTHLTEEEAKELYDHKKHQRNYEEIVQSMSSGVCDVLLLSEEGEQKDFEHEFDVEEVEIVKTNDEDRDTRDAAYKIFGFFFPAVYEKVKKIEKTLAIIRPQLLELQKDEILEEIKNARFTIARQKEITLSENQVTKFYRLNDQGDLPPEFIEYMISGPILVLALVRDNAIYHWKNLLGPLDVEEAKQDYPLSLRARFALEDIPFNQLHGSHNVEIAMKELRFFFPVEHTLVAIKPDALREYRDAILAKIQEASFTISAIKSVEMSEEIAREFYIDQEEESFFSQLIENMSQGPSVMMILTKENAVREWRELMGPADLELAKTSFPNSLRAQFATSILRNGLHSSSNVQHAKKHIKLLFGDALLDASGIVLDEEGLADSSTTSLPISPSAAPSTTAADGSNLEDVDAPTDEKEITTSDTTLAPGTQDVSAPGEAPDAGAQDVSAPGETPDTGTQDVSAPGEAPDAGAQDVSAPGEAPDAGSQEVSAPGEAPDAGTQEVSAPGEAPDAGSQEVSAPGEAPDAGSQEVSAPGEAPDAGTQDVSAPVETPDAGTQDVSASGEAPDAGSQEVSAPGEAPDAGTQDVSAPVETPDAGTQDVSASGEAPDAGTQDVSAPSEAPDADSQEVSAPGEAPDASTLEVSAPGEAPDAGTQEVSAPGEAPDAGTQDVSAPGEAPDAGTQDVSAPGEAPDAGTQDVSAPGEAPDAGTQDVSAPGEAPDAGTQDVSAPGEAPDAGTQVVSAPSETPDASTQDVSAPGEAPDTGTQDVSAPGEAPDADSQDVSAPGEAPDADTQDVSAPGEAPDAGTQDVSAPGESPDAGTQDVSAPGEAPDAGSQDVSAPGETPDASTQDVSAPVEATDAGSQEVSAPTEAPDASTQDVSPPGEAPDADSQDVSAPGEAPDADSQDVSVPGEAPDADFQDVSAPGEAPDAESQDVSAPSEVPDADSQDVSAPGEAPDADSQDVSAPGETPDVDSQDVSAPGDAPDANSQDVSAPGDAPDADSQDVSVPTEAP
ncbi:thioredoxin domain-containing protein 3 homolog [Heptranchias perlo]|uniref:thioredoxin domain-containing protein 3 homolog n=1 Tax=Heptranchias perlo TaxID=212740 RepID=UPI003559493D